MVNLKLLKTIAQHLSVLYVEDDLEIQEEMFAYLSRFFKKIHKASDGVEGLKLYNSEKFDIIITDLSMPNMNGIEMLEKIRANNPQQEVLITSAHTEAEYMINAIKIGVDGYILKPFDYEQLNYELFKIVEKINKYRENEEYKSYLQRMVNQKTSELKTIISFQKYNYDKTLLSMVEMIEDRDTYTAGHSQRVAHYSKMIAQEMEYSKDDCQKVFQAGILHDIGKIATPDVVLLNPQKLNDIEYKLIQEHVEVGYKLLSNIPMFEDLADIVHDHHERSDGSGYPRKVLEAEIHPLARIMAIADTFDAMTTNRIYKGRKSVAEALEEIVSLGGTLYAKDAVKAAQKVLKNVKIDEDIDQLPHTDLEKERFSYFYKDMLTNLYNSKYLELTLVRNSFEKKYKYIHLFLLKNFTEYNKHNGWKSGNDMLQNVTNILTENSGDSSIFRVFGDDFLILSKEKNSQEKVKNLLDALLKNSCAHCELVTFDLQSVNITRVDELEKLY